MARRKKEEGVFGSLTVEDYEPYVPELGYTQDDQAEPDAMDVGAFAVRLAQLQSTTNWSRNMLVGGPELTASVNLSEEQRYGMAVSQADEWLSSLYGAEVSPWLMASRMTDSAQRSDAFNQLRGLAAGETPIKTREVGAGRGVTVTEYQDPLTGEWSRERPSVTAQPGAFEHAGINELTHRSAALTAFYATQQDRRGPDGEIVSTYDYEQVLSPSQIKQLEDAVRHGVADASTVESLVQLTPFSTNEFKGSMVRVEPGSGTFELSEEFALAHPVRAAAAMAFIQDKMPGAEVRIGGQGLVHPATEMLGRPIDFVSGGPALAYKWAARGVGEIAEASTMDEDTRNLWAKNADVLQKMLEDGDIPPDQVEDAIRDISRFRDFADAGNIMNEGEGFESDLHDAFLPENAGMGLATTAADGIGLYEGDALYTPYVSTLGLIHNFSIMDPLGWIGDVRRGLALAEKIPTGSISGITRKSATAAGMKAFVENGGTANRYLADTQWVRISATADPSPAARQAATAELRSQLTGPAVRRKQDVLTVTNADGTEDLLILGMSSEEGLALARRAGQESFRTADGVIFTDRTITPVDWGRADDVIDPYAGASDILHAEGAAYGVRFDVPDEAARLKPAPPKVSRNWLVQRAYSQYAKTPDEILHTPEALRTADRLYEEVSAARKLGEAEMLAKANSPEYVAKNAGQPPSPDQVRKAGSERALGYLARLGTEYDPGILKALADARSGDEVHQIFMAGMQGGIQDPLQVNKIMTRQADITRRLGEIDNELAQHNRVVAQLADYAERIGLDGKDLNKNISRLRDFTDGGRGGGFRELVDRYQRGMGKLAALDAERIDLIGERYANQSILDLDEVTVPFREMPGDALVKQLNKTPPSERSDVEELLSALSREDIAGREANLEKLRDILTRRGASKREVARVMKQARRAQDQQARKVFRVWRNINTKMTGGDELHMPVPGHGQVEGQLVDYQMRTLQTIKNRAKLFGLSAADAEELMASYLRVQNREDWFQFVKKFYQDIADKSPYLDARSRMEMRQTHQDLLAERGGGYINSKTTDGIASKEHTLSRIVQDPHTGNDLESGVPAFSGDWLDTVRLPSNELDMQHLSRVRRWTERSRNLDRSGLEGTEAASAFARQASAEALMGVRDVINASTYIWKSAVLMGRMPFALLSRIQGEQAFRMAALDYASGVNHPIEWLRSVLARGDYGRFKNTHAEFLGTLADNYNDVHSFGRSVGHVRRMGRTTLSPTDGTRYWNALSNMFKRRYRSAEVAVLLDNEPADVLTWMRGPNSGPVGDGLIDNILSTRRADDATPDDEYLIAAISRMQQELDELVGGNDELVAVLKRGSTYAKREATQGYYRSERLDPIEGVRERTLLQIQGEQGEYVRLQKAGENWHVDYVEVPEALRGQGLGRRLYARAQAEAELNGGHLISDTDSLSEDARRVWEGLVRDGKARKIPPRARGAYGGAEYEYIAREYKRHSTIIDPSVGVGTRELANKLKELSESGEYIPPQFMNAKAAEYVAENPANLAGRFRDFMFSHFYQNPDVKLSRGPMYRQAAAKEYDRLVSLGWGEERATAAAAAYAAEQTSEWMYDLAARTSAQYFLRNVIPFFPAYQELGGVWLKRLPMQRGGGGLVGWAAGSALFAHRADVLFNFFEDTGMIYKNADGEYVYSIPGLNELVRHLTGNETFEAQFRVDSLAGMLPFPRLKDGEIDLESFKTIIPGLGPWPSQVLGKLADHNDVIDEIANFVMPYGDDPRLGPTSVNAWWTAITGQSPPWEGLNRDTEQLFWDFSVEDAIRSVGSQAPPYPENGTVAEKRAWSENIIAQAEKRARMNYAIRATIGMLSPSSAVITDEYSEGMTEIWKFIEKYKEGNPDASIVSPLIEGFKRANPGAVWYTNGAQIDHSDERNAGDFDQWIKDWRAGNIKRFSPQEFVEWNMGMTVYWNTVGIKAKSTTGLTAPQILTHGFERAEVRDDAQTQFDAYLHNHPVFERLFSEWEQAMNEREPGEVSLSALQGRINEAQRLLGNLDDLFTVNGVRDGDYRKILGKLSEKVEYVASKSDDPAWKAVDWWYNNVGEQAAEAMAQLYDTAFNLPAPERGPIFEQLRQLKNQFEPVRHNGQLMPTPEEVWWGNKSPAEQHRARLNWASSPVEWLSNFEMERAGYGNDPLWDEMATMINRDEQQIKEVAARLYLSPSSNDYKALQAQAAASQVAWASEHGMLDEWAMTQASPAARVIYTGAHGGNRTFEALVSEINVLDARFEANGYSLAGSTAQARQVQEYLFAKIEAARKADAGFGELMTEFEYVFADGGRERAPGYEMYFKLFLDYFGPTPYVR